MSGPKVLIAGAGIAGLTLGNALSRRGLRVTLVEAAATLQPAGLGLSLQPNGVRALQHAGLGKAVVEAGIRATKMVTADAAENSLRELDLRTAGPTVSIERGALVEVLLNGLDVDVRLSTTVGNVVIRDGSARVHLSDGSADEYELVVGADGLRSDLRQHLFPDASLSYRGYRAWRTLVPRDTADPDFAVLRWGRGVCIGTFPVNGEWLYVFVLEHGPDDRRSASAHAAQIRRIAEGFGPVARSVAKRVTDDGATIYTPVYQVELEKWRSGSVVLIGDAAHAIVPMLAQGAALAIEDAVVLAEAIAHFGDPLTAASRYEQARRPRIEEVAAICGFMSMAVGLEGPLDAESLRDHPGNPDRYSSPAEPQLRLWGGFEPSLEALEIAPPPRFPRTPKPA